LSKKRPKIGKSKAIAFTFRPFLATYFIFEKEAKNSKKVRLYRPLAHDVTAPVTMHLEDKLSIYA
jgi:hypothetical protein